MSKPIIEVRGVSKRYQLGQIGFTSLRAEIERWWSRGKNGDDVTMPGEFWALRDVSFDVRPGEVVGIIGRNGAGKSTLLKILSEITEPTAGEIRLRGRTASLLEVGTGFHPELSGRENIFLNGAILGMRRAEIARKFDEIVAFAEVEQFIDTAVKRYSSGMYVRLAFAVAAHLEPEILIVDEVLAVGDQSFQQKCLGKMRDVSRQDGRTVFFVSHNLGAVRSLATRTLHLDHGRIAAFGPTSEIINRYLSENCGGVGVWAAERSSAHPLQIQRVRMLTSTGTESSEFDASEGFTVEIAYEVRAALRKTLVEFFILTADGVHLLTSGDHDAAPERHELRTPGTYAARVRIPGDLLNLGSYILRVNSGNHHETFDSEDVLAFRIFESRQTTTRYNRRGHLVPMLPWHTARL